MTLSRGCDSDEGSQEESELLKGKVSELLKQIKDQSTDQVGSRRAGAC